jgi:hypothetical protein
LSENLIKAACVACFGAVSRKLQPAPKNYASTRVMGMAFVMDQRGWPGRIAARQDHFVLLIFCFFAPGLSGLGSGFGPIEEVKWLKDFHETC